MYSIYYILTRDHNSNFLLFVTNFSPYAYVLIEQYRLLLYACILKMFNLAQIRCTILYNVI